MSKFGDLTVEANCLGEIINENKFESQIFADWLVRANKTVKDVFESCKQKLGSGEYELRVVKSNEALEKIVCRKCGIKLFAELAYQYRRDLTKEEIGSIN